MKLLSNGWIMIYRYGLFSICFSISVCLFSQSVDFIKGDLDSIFDANTNNDRLYFIDVYTDWCGPCKRLDKESFDDAAVSQYMNEEFINIKLNPEVQEDNTWFTIKHKVNSYPTLLFVNAKREVVSEISGYRTKDELYSLMQNINKLWKSNGELIKELLVKNPLDIGAIDSFLEEYGGVAYSGMAELAELYLNEMDESDYNAKVLISMSELIRYLEAPIFEKVLNHEIRFIEGKTNWQYFDRLKLLGAIRNRIKDNLDLAIDLEDEKEFERFIRNLKSIDAGVKEKEIASIRLRLYERIDVNRYFILAEELIGKYITPFAPEEIRQQEEAQFKALRSDASRKYFKEFVGEEPNENVYENPLDSLRSLYPMSEGAAERLDELGDTVLKLHAGDPDKTMMAIEWKRLAIDYFPYVLSRYEKLAILYRDNSKEQEVESLLEEGRRMSLYKTLSEHQAISLE